MGFNSGFKGLNFYEFSGSFFYRHTEEWVREAAKEKQLRESRDDDEKLLELWRLLWAAGHYVTSNDVSTKLTYHRNNNTISSP